VGLPGGRGGGGGGPGAVISPSYPVGGGGGGGAACRAWPRSGGRGPGSRARASSHPVAAGTDLAPQQRGVGWRRRASVPSGTARSSLGCRACGRCHHEEATPQGRRPGRTGARCCAKGRARSRGHCGRRPASCALQCAFCGCASQSGRRAARAARPARWPGGLAAWQRRGLRAGAGGAGRPFSRRLRPGCAADASGQRPGRHPARRGCLRLTAQSDIRTVRMPSVGGRGSGDRRAHALLRSPSSNWARTAAGRWAGGVSAGRDRQEDRRAAGAVRKVQGGLDEPPRPGEYPFGAVLAVDQPLGVVGR